MTKHIYLYLILITLIFPACQDKEVFKYSYEKNPQYSWGYSEFWGAHYANYGLRNHVLSLSAFTDSLTLDKKNSLQGFGQYLYLEDIFISPADTIFPEGTYEVSSSREAMTITPGELYDKDGVKYDLGASIHFFERESLFTIRKFITAGNMIISYADNKVRFDFNFILEDQSDLKGRYETEKLILYDKSVSPQSAKQKIKLNPVYPSVILQFVKKQDQKRENRYSYQ